MTPTAFPRAARYNREWIRQNSLGENPIAQAEALSHVIPMGPETRVLDLGCGKAISSIFLALEFGAQVWAVDKRVSPTENLARVREAGCGDRVFPLRADARDLPFAEGFFDTAIAIDCYHYFGTDERFLPLLLRFLKRGGHVGIADVAFAREIRTEREAPGFLRETFAAHWSFVHSISWWKAQWEKTGCVEVVSAGVLPESRELLLDYARDRLATERRDEIARAAACDPEEWIRLFTLVGRTTAEETLSRS